MRIILYYARTYVTGPLGAPYPLTLECPYALFQRGLMSCLSKWLTFLVLFSTIFSYCGAGEMDALYCEGIHADMPKTELVAKVSRLPVERIQRIRMALFDEAKKNILALPEDVLVSRQKHANGNPLWEKLADDVCALLTCIGNNDPIPRQLLRNGKRSAAEFEALRKKHKPEDESNQGGARDVLVDVPMTTSANNCICAREAQVSDTPTSLSPSNTSTRLELTNNYSSYVANTVLVSEINSLKEGVAELKAEILHL